MPSRSAVHPTLSAAAPSPRAHTAAIHVMVDPAAVAEALRLLRFHVEHALFKGLSIGQLFTHFCNRCRD
eukprot:SAG11_NODE_1676_length_4475_cov_6.069698_2_plen_69_part_00